MYIDLLQLEQDELRISHQYGEQFEMNDPSVQVVSAPAIALRLQRAVGREVRVRGRLTAKVEVPCDRCLSCVEFPVSVTLDLFYAPIEVLTPDQDVPLMPQDLDYGFYRDNVLDVDVLVREQILLALPFRRLCQPECRGLCPSCGADLNKEVCACAQKPVAPHWAVLQQLKNRG